MKYWTIRWWVTRMSHPLRGLKYAFTLDFAVRFETIVFGIIGIPVVYFLLSHPLVLNYAL